MKLCTFLCIFLLLSIVSFAQEMHTVNGKITDLKDGTPLTGVTVKAKGHNTVALSKQDGSFTINVPADTKTLQFSFIGYTDLEASLSDSMVIRMAAGERNLSEVVVVGYGRAVKRDITGSISKLP